MKTIYIYPMSDADKIDKEHPYIAELCRCLTPFYSICNYGKKSKLGIIDIINYWKKIDILYLNWIEDLGRARLGILQTLFFLFATFILRLQKKEIVWTHHNIHSHSGKNTMNTFLTNFMIRYATHIIIHSEGSKKYIPEKYWSKTHFFFHPVPDYSNKITETEKEYDILIWGGVRKSKGVDFFLQYLSSSGLLDRITIRIVGKINDAQLRNEVMAFESDYIRIEDRFVNDHELQDMHAKARFIFFPYTGSSVLNSGIVVKSLVLGTPIIGPDKGAFTDLKNAGLICVFNDFDEAFQLISSPDIKYDNQKVKTFCKKYSWVNFGSFLKNTIQ